MAEFYWVTTTVGLAKRAAAEAGGTPIDMRTGQFAVGDGNGVYADPDPTQIALVNEKWRGPLNRVYINALDPTLMICETSIPVDVGGWDIREAGIIDADGDLIAVGKYPLITKPDPSSGAARTEYIRGGFRISNGGDTVLTIDNSVVMATLQNLDDHAADTAPHQATSAATASRLMLRDAAGRAKIAAPAAADDIARKDTVDTHATRTDNPHAVTAVQVGAADKDILRVAYPVGSLYFNASVAANPATWLGFGTWVAFGVGRMLLGVGGGFAAGQTGGEVNHQLTVAELPSHDHTGPTYKYLLKPPYGGSLTGSDATGSGTEQAVGYLDGGQMLSVGQNTPHNNMPPYVAVYIWQRTA